VSLSVLSALVVIKKPGKTIFTINIEITPEAFIFLMECNQYTLFIVLFISVFQVFVSIIVLAGS
jgi:hypothetical protein